MCEGRCQVQFYDVDFSGVTITADKDNGNWCTAQPTQEITDQVQPYFVKIGCKEDDCVCELYPDQAPQWTDWETYTAPNEVIIFVGKGTDKPCKYTLTGTYKVATSIEDGLCIKTPNGWKPYARRKKPAKKAGGGPAAPGPKKPKKASSKPRRAGGRHSGLRRRSRG